MSIDERHDRIATASEIRELVGALDDSVIAGIAALGATQGEIIEAKAWLTADDDLHRELHRAPSGRVAQIVDILEEAVLPGPDQP
jgi:hypothetical protein